MHKVISRLKISVLIFAVFFLISQTLPAFATLELPSGREDEWAENNFLFYNPNGSANGSTTGTWNGCSFDVSGDSLQDIVLSFLASLGLSPVAMSGIYGNMMAEGLAGNQPLRHEGGVGSISKVGTCYSAATHYSTCTGAPKSGLRVREVDVKDLYNPEIMHGLGFIQWSFSRRVNLLNALGEYAKYATEWNGSSYTYDLYTYEKLKSELGDEIANGIVTKELDFFLSEHKGYSVTNDDITAQGISKYGITAGMNIFDALNKLTTPAEAATLFYSTSEMPSTTNLDQSSSRISYANKGYEHITGGSFTPGSSTCPEANNGDINATAIALAYPEHGHGLDPSPAYRAALDAVGFKGDGWGDENVPRGSSCDVFVTTVMKYSGADPDFKCCRISTTVEPYLRNSPKWVEVPNDLEHLQPGDVRVSNGHVEIYVEVNGVGKIASASHGDRTAEIGNFYNNADTFKAYRLVRSSTQTNED